MLEIHLRDLIECSCITADDLGATGYGGAIAYTNPHCPLHGECRLVMSHGHA